MKTLIQVEELLAKFEGKYGLRISGAQQQSEAWYWAKLGVLSASNASKIVAKRDSETRHTYMCDLIAQVCTGLHTEISAAALDHGNQYEDAARAYYELTTNLHITPVPFIFKDDSFREGASPDAFVTENRICEIKCPLNSANYAKFLVSDDIKPEWRYQAQFIMRVTGCERFDFCMYDPRFKVKPLKILPFERDDEAQKKFDDAVPQFIEDLDKALAQIGIQFGEQWKRIAAELD